MHMAGDANIAKARSIAETLNKAFFHHGYPVGRREAKEMDLPVVDPSPTVEGWMWEIWLDVERELEVRKPFSPMFELMKTPGEAIKLLAPGAVGAPSEVTNAVDFELIAAIMESTRKASRDMRRGKVVAYRDPELNLQSNAITTGYGWEPLTIPALP